MSSRYTVHCFNADPCAGHCQSARDAVAVLFSIFSVLSLLVSIPITFCRKLWMLWQYSNENYMITKSRNTISGAASKLSLFPVSFSGLGTRLASPIMHMHTRYIDLTQVQNFVQWQTNETTCSVQLIHHYFLMLHITGESCTSEDDGKNGEGESYDMVSWVI